MQYLGALLTALLLTCVAGGPTDCRKTYQDLLDDAATVKKNCKEASPKDCCQIKKIAPWSTTGSYEVADTTCSFHKEAFTNTKSVKMFARCDMESAGGKWMVIQRRINGSVDFYLNWDDYVYGFGDLEGEFWYGLEKIHCLTTREDVELRIELGNGTEPSIVWTYQLFRVGGADTNYRLTIGEASGVGGTSDAMAIQNGSPFSTRDRDNDAWGHNCAKVYGGAWWYKSCFHSNLNGKYELHTPENYSGHFTPGANRLGWNTNGSSYQHYTNVQMKIRPKRCSADEESTCE